MRVDEFYRAISNMAWTLRVPCFDALLNVKHSDASLIASSGVARGVYLWVSACTRSSFTDSLESHISPLVHLGREHGMLGSQDGPSRSYALGAQQIWWGSESEVQEPFEADRV